ncbi:MAG TPA: hypothetical protein VIU82_07520 [Bosea sp. (in: a-proteobacteria)]
MALEPGAEGQCRLAWWDDTMSGEFFGFVVVPAILFVGGWLFFYVSESAYEVILSKVFGAIILTPFLFILYMSKNMPHVHDDARIAPTYGLFVLSGLIFAFSRKIGIFSVSVPYAVILYFYFVG